MDIVKSAMDDYKQIIEVAELAFDNVGFKTLLPKLYAKSDYVDGNHYLVKTDGKIKSIVGSFENNLTVLNHTLKYRGIGTVSVASESRGKGYMKQLMMKAVSDAKADNVDFMALSGKRKRYEYFGFTTCGIEISMDLNKSEMKHSKHLACGEIKLVPISQDLSKAQDCCELYNKMPLHATRNVDNFVEIASSWRGEVFLVYKNDTFVGYFSGDKSSIKEIILTDYSDTIAVMLAWFDYNNEEPFSISTLVFQKELIYQLNRISSNTRIGQSCGFNVLNYKNVICAFLQLKGELRPLVDGNVTINVDDVGTYEIIVKQGVVTVRDSDDKTPDISLPHLNMMHFLFSPVNYFGYTQYSIPQSKIATVSNWLPIPLLITHTDNY